jgi:hypothetical protein
VPRPICSVGAKTAAGVSASSAEDLIVMKAFAARPKDWVDVEGIVIRQGEAIDWNSIEHHLRPLVALKEEPEILELLERIRRG